jgi:subtilisin family serine protease
MIAVVSVCVPRPAAAQLKTPQFIDITVRGKLRPETRKALKHMLESTAFEQLLIPGITLAEPVADLCSKRNCSQEDVERIQQATSLASQEIANYPKIDMSQLHVLMPQIDITAQTETDSNQTFFVVGPESQAFKTSKLNAEFQEPVAVPVSQTELKQAIEDGLLQTTDRALPGDGPLSGTVAIPLSQLKTTSVKKLELIEQDLQKFGVSSRQFRLNNFLTEEQLASAKAALLADSNIDAEFKDTAPQGFTFDEAIVFETDSDVCQAVNNDWPFDIESVINIMRFNERVLNELGIDYVRRSKILIIDTGIGRALLDDISFQKNVFVNISERLSADILYKNDFGFHNSKLCVDHDGNDYDSDIFGASPTGDLELSCDEPLFPVIRLTPIQRNPKSPQSYAPEHGSFVAGLAIGTRRFVESFPAIRRYVGLSFFRVTRRSNDSRLSVKTDRSDLVDAFRYAEHIAADVINISLKTRDYKLFTGLKEELGQIGLIVTSAGNLGEDLDASFEENLPASLPKDHPLRDRLLVIAALKSDAAEPWWLNSAHSKKKVDIAAPGVSLLSYDDKGNDICGSGTSAAAPLVTFTAATLKALGIPTPLEIKYRILSTADFDSRITDKVADGRRLNIEAALDVFVDQLWFKDDTKARRGWIEPASNRPPALLPICGQDTTSNIDKFLAQSHGKIDLSNLWYWHRGDDAQGQFRHKLESRFTIGNCPVQNALFRFIDLSTGAVESIEWSRVKKLVPTPFRKLKEIVLKLSR